MYYTEGGELKEDRYLIYQPRRRTFMKKIPVVKDMRLRSNKKYQHYNNYEEDIYAVPHKPPKKSNASSSIVNCPVCFEVYTLETVPFEICRAPLFLCCHHSICSTCVPKMMKQLSKPNKDHVGDVVCPQCRMITPIPPNGLSTNFYILTLLKQNESPTYVNSRLMMWCEDCQTIAEDGCSQHEVTHLKNVLSGLETTYYERSLTIGTKIKENFNTCKTLTTTLEEAIDGLDKAAHVLRVKLQNHLENVNYKYGTASSLLQQLEGMSIDASTGASSAPILPPRNNSQDSEAREMSSLSDSSNNSKLYPDLNDNAEQSTTPKFSKSISMDSGLAAPNNDKYRQMGKGTHFSTNNTSLSSYQQEQRINTLKSNLTTLKQIEYTIEEQRHSNQVGNANSHSGAGDVENYLTIDEVKVLFDKAIDAINYCINMNA